MAIYLQIGAKDEIKGNVTSAGHENWIECSSMQFGCGRSIPMLVGTQTNREASHPSLSEVVLTKAMDDSSPYILQEALVGESKPVIIHVTKTGAKQLENLVEYTLTAALISSYSVSSSGDSPSESFSFAYTKIEMRYIQWDKEHKKGTPVPVSYDLAQAVPG